MDIIAIRMPQIGTISLPGAPGLIFEVGPGSLLSSSEEIYQWDQEHTQIHTFKFKVQKRRV